MIRSLLRLLPLLLAFSLARADTLVLANGDRLSGRTVSIESGVIHFDATALGLLSLPSSSAHVEPTPADETKEEKADHDSRESQKPRDFKSVDFRAAARDPKRAQSKSDTGWLRKIEFGFSGQRNGSDRTDLAMRFELGRRARTHETRLQFRHLYGETDDVTSTDNTSASLRLRRNLSEVMFGQSATSYDRDGVRGVEHDFQQGLGVGRNFIARDDFVLAMGAGASGRNRAVGNETDGWSLLVDAFQDLTYEFNERLSLKQDLAMLVAPARGSDYRIKFNAAVNTRLTAALELSMRYEYEFDRAVEPAERESQRLVTSVGVIF